MDRIDLAVTDAEIERAAPVMRELRPQIPRDAFVSRVRRQEAGGYRLAYLESDGEIRAVAGFRFGEFLAWGKVLYVDDLVTAASERSKGHGERLLGWLLDHARSAGCDELHLDSGVQRFDAHRFYLRKRMDITCHHFAIKVPR